jgi:L-rhamnose mutarotase
MQRIGQVIGIKPEHLARYIQMHDECWPEIVAANTACNIHNYTIFLYNDLLFSYGEYMGTDYAADMARLAASPRMQEWWALMSPMQQPVPERQPGEHWARLRAVYHQD